MDAIRVDNLTRQFNGFTAVDRISFTVQTGELFGLLGPNGAGKTTTINMLATLLKPTSGCAEVAGYNVALHRDDVRRSIGVVFQDPALDTKLTGKENLEFHAMMYGLSRDERTSRLADVLRLVELDTPAQLKDILGGDVVSMELEGEVSRRRRPGGSKRGPQEKEKNDA